MDMYSGGGIKVPPYEEIYIQASSRKEAIDIFRNRFGRNPNNVTCDCCDEDYSVSEYETLEQATATNCRVQDMSFSEYIKQKNVLVIYEDEIRKITLFTKIIDQLIHNPSKPQTIKNKKMKQITKDNFFIESTADFKEVDNAPNREPDYVSYKRGFVSYDEKDGDEDFRVIDGKEYILLSKYDPRDPRADEDGCVTDLFLIVDKKFNFDDELIGLYYLDKDIVSSTYWYTEEGVYRKSNHWGWCGDCYWTIDGKEYNSHKEIVGYCKWEDFREDDFHPLIDEEKPCDKVMLRGVLIA